MQRQLLFIPGPVMVADPVLAAMARPMIDHRGPEFAALQAKIVAGLQPMFGTEAEVVLLGSSGSGGLEAAISGSFSPGEKVLVCPVGVFGKRLASIAKAWGIEAEVLETAPGAAVDANALASRLRKARSGEFAGILLTHNETSTGVQNDLAALSAAIGEHPATVIVDSVSGLGASEFRMDEWDFDIVVTASQKALAVPPGLAMVAVSQRAWERMKSARGPRFYFDLLKAREFAQQGQTPWTPPVSLYFALDVALERYHAGGARAAFARHAGFATAIRAAAEAMGLEVFSHPGAHSCTVVAIALPASLSADALRRMLREEMNVVMGGGQAELKGKILRMGTMGALTRTDVLGGLGALEMALLVNGHPLQAGAGMRAALATFLEAEAAVA